MKKVFFSLVVAICLASTGSAQAYGHGYGLAEKALKEVEGVFTNRTADVPAKGRLEVAFSPDEGSEKLVIKVIDSASKVERGEILMLTYSFTSAPVTEALIRAVHHGVTVRLVADQKGNMAEKSRAALSALKNAGADVRSISAYAIHHDKVIIVNRQTVELGSFNYSAAAAHSNSENVLVNWDNPELAAVYLKHFERNYKQSTEFSAQY